MGQKVESELKLRVASLEAARRNLERVGAVPTVPRHLEDNVLYDQVSGSIRESGSVLRLRTTPDGGLLTFKGPKSVEKGLRSRTEAETTLQDPAACDAILTGLGFVRSFRYQKYRQMFSWEGLEICLDETPLGNFLEIEGDPAAVHQAATTLGYGLSDIVPLSYVELHLASGRGGDMVFED